MKVFIRIMSPATHAHITEFTTKKYILYEDLGAHKVIAASR